MPNTEETLDHLNKAKENLDKAIQRISDKKVNVVPDDELKKISDAAKALLDINGVC